MKHLCWFGIYLLLGVLLGSCANPIAKIRQKFTNHHSKKFRPKLKKKIVEGPTQLGNGTFVEKSTIYGLDNLQATNFYVVDFDQDGFEDLVTLPDFYSIPQFWHFNSVKARFERMKENPFGRILRASYLRFADFNGDQVPDVLVGVFNQKSAMNREPLRLFVGSLRDHHYRLIEVKKAFPASSRAPNAAIALLDYNLDGFLDVYVAHWFDVAGKRPEIVPDAFYQGSGTKFKEVSFILKDELLYEKNIGYYKATPTIAATSCDIDLDGYPDVLTSATAGYPNKLWKNVRFPGGGRAYADFGDVTMFAQDKEGKLLSKQGGYSLFALCLDYNNDSIVDVVTGELSHQYDAETRDRSSVLTGAWPNKIKFIRSEYYRDDGSDNWDQADRRAVAFDYDGDGLIDFTVDNSGFPPKSRLILFHQQADHGYSDVAKQLGVNVLNPSGTVVVDFNQDGKPDILTGHSDIRRANIEKRVFLFENQIKNDSRWVRIFLNSSTHANSWAIGAVVRVRSGHKIQTRFIGQESGEWPSQSTRGALVAIPREEQIDDITILWPYRDKKHNPIKKVYRNINLKPYTELHISFEQGIL